MTFQKGNQLGEHKGRPKGMKNIGPAKAIELVTLWVEYGNFTRVSEESGINRKSATQVIKKWIENNPEQYNKMLDAFLMRNKQMMIMQNAHTTQKALDKVDELLDTTESLKEASMAYGILHDKGALMRGEATQNSAVIVKLEGLEELSK